MKNNWWTSFAGKVLCSLLGHKEPARFWETGKILCDCPVDHTYLGCSRCRIAIDSYDY